MRYLPNWISPCCRAVPHWKIYFALPLSVFCQSKPSSCSWWLFFLVHVWTWCSSWLLSFIPPLQLCNRYECADTVLLWNSIVHLFSQRGNCLTYADDLWVFVESSGRPKMWSTATGLCWPGAKTCSGKRIVAWNAWTDIHGIMVTQIELDELLLIS